MDRGRIVIELQKTPIQDGRLLIEVIKGGSSIASAPCMMNDPIDRGRCIASLVHQAPALEDMGLESKLIEPSAPMGIAPIPFVNLVRDYPAMRPEVIAGILRQGETMNIISSAKIGKSFLAGGMAWSVATGRDWLSHTVTQSKVLILDNELHPETLASRLDRIADAMMIDHADRAGAIDVIPLRGLGIDVENVSTELTIPEGEYGLVIVDALYRWLPDGCSENDNAKMMRVYNRVDELAARWGAAVAIVHHSSKGDQGDKAQTDVGSGAGSIARAADVHLTIRPHQQFGLQVLEGSCRSFAKPEPVSIRYEYPLWEAVGCPAELKTSRPLGEASQEKNDAAGKQAILEEIPEGRHVAKRKLRDLVGMGDGRLSRLLGLLVKDGKVKITRRKKKGTSKSIEVVSRVGTGDGTADGTDQTHTK